VVGFRSPRWKTRRSPWRASWSPSRSRPCSPTSCTRRSSRTS